MRGIDSVLALDRAEALRSARARYPSLSPDDHDDIVQQALAQVLARLRAGAVALPQRYLLAVVHTVGARLLARRAREADWIALEHARKEVDARADRTLQSAPSMRRSSAPRSRRWCGARSPTHTRPPRQQPPANRGPTS